MSCETEPFTCGISSYLQVDSVRSHCLVVLEKNTPWTVSHPSLSQASAQMKGAPGEKAQEVPRKGQDSNSSGVSIQRSGSPHHTLGEMSSLPLEDLSASSPRTKPCRPIYTSYSRFPWGAVKINCRDPFINCFPYSTNVCTQTGNHSPGQHAETGCWEACGISWAISYFFLLKWKEAEDRSSSPCSATHLVCGQEPGPPEPHFPHLCTELSLNTLSEEPTECPWKLQ